MTETQDQQSSGGSFQGTPVVLDDGTILRNSDGTPITEEELEESAARYECGDYGDPGEWGPVIDGLPENARGPVKFVSIRRGRPKINPQEAESTETVSFKLPHSQLAKLDQVAKAHGRTRSELLRIAVERVLEFA